jgi:hypothetical protein
MPKKSLEETQSKYYFFKYFSLLQVMQINVNDNDISSHSSASNFMENNGGNQKSLERSDTKSNQSNPQATKANLFGIKK